MAPVEGYKRGEDETDKTLDKDRSPVRLMTRVAETLRFFSAVLLREDAVSSADRLAAQNAVAEAIDARCRAVWADATEPADRFQATTVRSHKSPDRVGFQAALGRQHV
ncbi:MAG: hypothetical protein IPK26_22280 [Planctomycetes bacterium]|nr:hypothetical protein [Planctomycetota bacterium]